MKKIFAIALAVVMVLSIASVAGAAFNWGPGTTQSAETFASRYQIDVVKLVNETGIIGSNRVLEDDNATAVNNAPVYFYIRLTVSGSDVTAPDAIQENAEVRVEFTSLENWDGSDLTNVGYLKCKNMPNGTYYYVVNPATGDWRFQPITSAINNSEIANAVIEARCLDTETAKVTATVRSRRPLVEGSIYEVGNFKFEVTNNNNNGVRFFDADGNHLVTFARNADGLVIDRIYAANVDSEDVMKLYAWLNDGNANTFMAALENKEVYMSNDNLWAAFGFSYSQSDSATWKANSTPIILDPIGIPKTGDNASVIGFAMIMVAVVAAAVAVRKVNA